MATQTSFPSNSSHKQQFPPFLRKLKDYLVIKTDNEDEIKDLLYGNADLVETCGIEFW